MVNAWLDWFETFSGVVIVAVAALPLAVLAVWVRARRRPLRQAMAEVGIVYGTAPWVGMIMQPGNDAGGVSPIPLRDLATVLSHGPWSATMQIVGNLLVFAALGFFAPIRFAALASVRRIVLLAAACSIVVEALQHVLQLHRVSSVDDVLLNAAGAGLFALLSRRWQASADLFSPDAPVVEDAV